MNYVLGGGWVEVMLSLLWPLVLDSSLPAQFLFTYPFGSKCAYEDLCFFFFFLSFVHFHKDAWKIMKHSKQFMVVVLRMPERHSTRK